LFSILRSDSKELFLLPNGVEVYPPKTYPLSDCIRIRRGLIFSKTFVYTPLLNPFNVPLINNEDLIKFVVIQSFIKSFIEDESANKDFSKNFE
jgi:hypothetical protein